MASTSSSSQSFDQLRLMIATPTEEETTFLCGFQKTRRYGSTSTPQQTRPRYSSIIRHRLLPTDTIQALALKYNCSVTDIKRLNRLWSNESLYLKDYVQIPVLDDSGGGGSSSGGTVVNGFDGDGDGGSTNTKSDKFVKTDQKPSTNGIYSTSDSGQNRIDDRESSTTSEPSEASSTCSSGAVTADPTKESMSDLFTRIDQMIKAGANNVKKLERESTIDTIADDTDEVDDSQNVPTSSRNSLTKWSRSRHSPHASPPVEMHRIRHSVDNRMQKQNDHFYQL